MLYKSENSRFNPKEEILILKLVTSENYKNNYKKLIKELNR